jgi:hypothetical protein
VNAVDWRQYTYSPGDVNSDQDWACAANEEDKIRRIGKWGVMGGEDGVGGSSRLTECLLGAKIGAARAGADAPRSLPARRASVRFGPARGGKRGDVGAAGGRAQEGGCETGGLARAGKEVGGRANWDLAANTYDYLYLAHYPGQVFYLWGTVYGTGQPILFFILDSRGTEVFGPSSWSGSAYAPGFVVPYADTFYIYLQNNWLFSNDTVVWYYQVCV